MLSNFSSNTDVAEHCLSDGTWQQFEENTITKPSGCMKWVGPMYKNSNGKEQPYIKIYTDYNTYVGTAKLRRVLSHWVFNESSSPQKIVGANVWACEHWECCNPAHQIWTTANTLKAWQHWGKDAGMKKQQRFETKLKVAA